MCISASTDLFLKWNILHRDTISIQFKIYTQSSRKAWQNCHTEFFLFKCSKNKKSTNWLASSGRLEQKLD